MLFQSWRMRRLAWNSGKYTMRTLVFMASSTNPVVGKSSVNGKSSVSASGRTTRLEAKLVQCSSLPPSLCSPLAAALKRHKVSGSVQRVHRRMSQSPFNSIDIFYCAARWSKAWHTWDHLSFSPWPKWLEYAWINPHIIGLLEAAAEIGRIRLGMDEPWMKLGSFGSLDSGFGEDLLFESVRQLVSTACFESMIPAFRGAAAGSGCLWHCLRLCEPLDRISQMMLDGSKSMQTSPRRFFLSRDGYTVLHRQRERNYKSLQ